MGCLWEKDLAASLYRVLRGDHAVAHSPGVGIDLKVIATLHRGRAERAYTGGAWMRLPGLGPSTHPAWGSLPLLAPAELPLLLSPQNLQKAPLLSLHQVCPALLCDMGQVSSQLWAPALQCNGAGEHWLFSGSLPGVLFCHPVWPGLDLG